MVFGGCERYWDGVSGFECCAGASGVSAFDWALLDGLCFFECVCFGEYALESFERGRVRAAFWVFGCLRRFFVYAAAPGLRRGTVTGNGAVLAVGITVYVCG